MNPVRVVQNKITMLVSCVKLRSEVLPALLLNCNRGGDAQSFDLFVHHTFPCDCQADVLNLC